MNLRRRRHNVAELNIEEDDCCGVSPKHRVRVVGQTNHEEEANEDVEEELEKDLQEQQSLE